jgi:hypothetical protein
MKNLLNYIFNLRNFLENIFMSAELDGSTAKMQVKDPEETRIVTVRHGLIRSDTKQDERATYTLRLLWYKHGLIRIRLVRRRTNCHGSIRTFYIRPQSLACSRKEHLENELQRPMKGLRKSQYLVHHLLCLPLSHWICNH